MFIVKYDIILHQMYKTLFIMSAIVTILCCSVQAQDRLEMGFMGGVSYYLGDLNHTQHFKSPRPAAGFVARYMVNDRIAARANVFGGGIAGEYPGMGDKYPVIVPSTGADMSAVRGSDFIGKSAKVDSEYDFSRVLVSVDLMGEFNFRSFDHVFNQGESRWAPYMTLGLGATFYKSYVDEPTGKTDFVLSLPFGLGIKYKLFKWLRVGLEWTMHKTFADDLDLVEPKANQINPNDPYGSKHHTVTHNNDWYSFCGITLTASMLPRKLSCNDGLRKFNK